MIKVFDSGNISYRIGDGLAASFPPRLFDHVITDPPYNAATHDSLRIVSGSGSVKINAGFPPIHGGEVVDALGTVAKRWGIFFCALEQLAEYKAAAGDQWVKSSLYLKTNPTPQITGDRPGTPGEGIALLHGPGKKAWNWGGRAGAFWATPERRRDTMHPTGKPLALMISIIEAFTSPGDYVLDPFAGSGATAIACEILDRKCLAIEINPEYAAAFLTRRHAALSRVDKLIAQAKRFQSFTKDLSNGTGTSDHPSDFC